MNDYHVKPIGFFRSSLSEKYEVPRQPNSGVNNEGVIILNPHCHFEQALEGLEGFDRLWIIFLFHRNHNWKPKVLPPRGHKKRGVFATRSPHRPNFIGLSCVELKSIEGLRLVIQNHDLLDGTPILDIKPYINYADSFTAAKQGWIDELEQESQFQLEWTERAIRLKNYLLDQGLDIKKSITLRLRTSPYPYPHNRIKKKDEGSYELAFKSWRILYEIKGDIVFIIDIYSGYDDETLRGEKSSRWEDITLHQEFINYINK